MHKTPMTLRGPPPQHGAPRQEAARLGITIADLVRRIVDEWLEAQSAKGRDRS